MATDGVQRGSREKRYWGKGAEREGRYPRPFRALGLLGFSTAKRSTAGWPERGTPYTSMGGAVIMHVKFGVMVVKCDLIMLTN